MSTFHTKQENFWAQTFGDEYIKRNSDPDLVRGLMPFWSDILRKTSGIKSVLELGANVGLNLKAIKMLVPSLELDAVEINKEAASELQRWGGCSVHNCSALDFQTSKKWDLVFTRGVLIHIDPQQLEHFYGLMLSTSHRYILIAEYYNPTPVDVEYRGHKGYLFKRDFAGELMDRSKSLRLVDYGFVYHRDLLFPQDDITWFLMEKTDLI